MIDREPGGRDGPIQDGSGTAVDLIRGEQDICRFYRAQVISLPEVLTEQTVGIFVRCTLPRAGRIIKVHECPSTAVASACLAISEPRQGPPLRDRQDPERLNELVTRVIGPVSWAEREGDEEPGSQHHFQSVLRRF